MPEIGLSSVSCHGEKCFYNKRFGIKRVSYIPKLNCENTINNVPLRRPNQYFYDL